MGTDYESLEDVLLALPYDRREWLAALDDAAYRALDVPTLTGQAGDDDEDEEPRALADVDRVWLVELARDRRGLAAGALSWAEKLDGAGPRATLGDAQGAPEFGVLELECGWVRTLDTCGTPDVTSAAVRHATVAQRCSALAAEMLTRDAATVGELLVSLRAEAVAP